MVDVDCNIHAGVTQGSDPRETQSVGSKLLVGPGLGRVSASLAPSAEAAEGPEIEKERKDLIIRQFVCVAVSILK